MTEIVLLGSTGDHGCDRIVRGVVEIFEICFPGRILGYYLRGSRASGTATAGSDLDVFVVFADRFTDATEFSRARELAAGCARLSPVLLEILPVGERGAGLDPVVGLNLKHGTRLLHGVDIRDDLPDFDPVTWIRAVVHTPYYSYALPAPRRERDHVSYPLTHLDPDGEFFGLDQWKMPSVTGVEAPSTKLLVATVGWTATAIVALTAGVYVADKAACVELYRRHVHDEWTGLVVDVHDLCRRRWHYAIPDEPNDRALLRALCERALGFCNHYLRIYHAYQLDELRAGDPDRRQLAAQRLHQMVFDDEDTRRLVAAAQGKPVR